MAINSKIEWAKNTLNLWHGCTKLHEGCDYCYAEKTSLRWKREIWGNDKPRRLIASAFSELKKYQTTAHEANEMHRVFVDDGPIRKANAFGRYKWKCNIWFYYE